MKHLLHLKSDIHKYKNIEFVRFLFAGIIVWFHLFSNIPPSLRTIKPFSIMASNSADAYLIVELFLIISGFFLYKTYKNRPDLSWIKFTIHKIARLWPVLAFSILCLFILGAFNVSHVKFYREFVNLFFMQCIGVTLDFKGINWYISPFFWVSIFYFYILKKYKQQNVNLAIALLSYFSCVGLVTYFNGGFGRATIYSFFNGGVMRCLFGIGVGYFIGILYDKIHKNMKNIQSIWNYIIISIIEIYCMCFLVYNFIFHHTSYPNKIIFILMFAILFILLLLRRGFLSNLLNNNISNCIGKYAYSIYVMQQVSFHVLGITLWSKHSLIVNYPLLMLILSVVFCIIVGIITFYLVERPVDRYIKNYKKPLVN